MPTQNPNTAWMFLRVPADQALLAALGRVAVVHGHHEHVLKRMLKTINEWPLEQADAGLKLWTAHRVREAISEDAERRLGPGGVVDRLRFLLDASESATLRRNDLIHGIWAGQVDGDPDDMHHGNAGWTKPAIRELEELATLIASLTAELNEARLVGWLVAALKATPLVLPARPVPRPPAPRG